MEKKILEWFGKTGYPLELWTEAQFVEAGFMVANSHIYEDQEGHDFRELDLVASHTWYNNDDSVAFGLEFLVECKKSEKPLILLRSSRKEKPEVSPGELYGTQDSQFHLLVHNENRGIPLPGRPSHGFKLVQAFAGSDELPHKATYTLIKSFHDWLKQHNSLLKYYIEDNYTVMALPLLVVDCPLFELSVGSDGSNQLVKVDSGIINQPTHLSRYPDSPFHIPIVHKDSLVLFLTSVQDFGKAQLEHLLKNPKAQPRQAYRSKSKRLATKQTSTNARKQK